MNKLLSAILVSSVLLVTGCASNMAQNTNAGLESGKYESPKKILFVPIDIEISELSASGSVEEVPEWSEQGRQHLRQHIMAALKEKGVEIITIDDLSDDEKAILDEHYALYDVVAGNYISITRGGEPFRHLVDQFDFSLGSGLSFLKERTGADTALFIYGQDYVSSGGRIFMAIALAAMGASIQMGHSVVHAGLVDVASGDLLWTNSSYAAQSYDMRKSEDTLRMVEAVFEGYPK